MAVRFVISSIVIVDNPDDDTGKPTGLTYRVAKVATLIDPATGRYYWTSAAMTDTDWCMCRVRGGDFTPIDADSEIKTILEHADDEKVLDITLKTFGMDAAKVADIKTDIAGKGEDATSITEDSTIGVMLDTLLKAVAPGLDVRDM